MKYLLALLLIITPTFASAATLTWEEYGDFLGILNHELVYIKKVKVNKNIVLAVMDEAEKRKTNLFENYYTADGELKLRTTLEYEAKRKELFNKVRDQIK